MKSFYELTESLNESWFWKSGLKSWFFIHEIMSWFLLLCDVWFHGFDVITWCHRLCSGCHVMKSTWKSYMCMKHNFVRALARFGCHFRGAAVHYNHKEPCIHALNHALYFLAIKEFMIHCCTQHVFGPRLGTPQLFWLCTGWHLKVLNYNIVLVIDSSGQETKQRKQNAMVKIFAVF